jgi:hypothetical protein
MNQKDTWQQMLVDTYPKLFVRSFRGVKFSPGFPTCGDGWISSRSTRNLTRSSTGVTPASSPRAANRLNTSTSRGWISTKANARSAGMSSAKTDRNPHRRTRGAPTASVSFRRPNSNRSFRRSFRNVRRRRPRRWMTVHRLPSFHRGHSPGDAAPHQERPTYEPQFETPGLLRHEKVT